jgi:hypothetical protein
MPRRASSSDSTNKAKLPAVAEPYVRTEREAAAIEALADQRRKARPAPRLKVTPKGDTNALDPDHPVPALGSALLMAAIGTTEPDFLEGLLRQLTNAGTQGRTPDEGGINFMLAVVKGIEPRDQIESMLAAQMAAVHMAAMTFARRLAHVDNIPQQDSAERTFNKLSRTFAAQMEALKRYRTSGQHRMIVEHVTVKEGGQAIIGNVSHGGLSSAEKGQPTP